MYMFHDLQCAYTTGSMYIAHVACGPVDNIHAVLCRFQDFGFYMYMRLPTVQNAVPTCT